MTYNEKERELARVAARMVLTMSGSLHENLEGLLLECRKQYREGVEKLEFKNDQQAQTILELQAENKKLMALIKYKQDQGLKWMQKKLLHAWPEVFSSFVVTALDQVQRGHIYINKQDAREAGIL